MSGGVYYNEIDRHAAAWTRELIKGGHIAQGIVDERSIEEVTPADLATFSQCHFFSGIATWQYACRLAGIGDAEIAGLGTLWTGSCPCQPFSGAGRRKGTSDARHLWPAWFRLIRECRPRLVVGEQVSSGDGLAWFDAVCANLEGAGYAVAALDIPAASVGAPHIRQRLYWVAIADRERREGKRLHVRERRPDADLSETWGGGKARGVADDGSDGRQDREQAGTAARTTGRRGDTCDITAPPQTERRMGDARRDGDRQHDRELHGHETQHEVRAAGGDHASVDPGATRYTAGFWRDPEWRECTDGKSRPIEPAPIKMVDGLADLVDYLCAVANQERAPEESEINVQRSDRGSAETLQALRAILHEETLRETPGGFGSLCEAILLRTRMHGAMDGRTNQGLERQERQTAGTENREAEMRSMRKKENIDENVRASSRRKPAEQCQVEPVNAVRVLSSSFALAQFRSDHRTAACLLALLEAFDACGVVLHPQDQACEIWRRINLADQDRIWMGMDLFSLSDDLEPLSFDRSPNRVMQLRGYGNGIVATQAAAFLRAALEAIAEVERDDKVK